MSRQKREGRKDEEDVIPYEVLTPPTGRRTKGGHELFILRGAALSVSS